MLISSPNEGAVCHILRLFAELSATVTKALGSIKLLHLCQSLIMIVTLEELLDAWSLEFRLVLEHLLGVRILPLAVCILCVKVVFVFGWLERGLNAFLMQSIPIETCEPFVLLDNVRTLLAQTVSWFTLDEAINQVSCLR